ncbi:unnamed protein product [Lathyrus oleraceus]
MVQEHGFSPRVENYGCLIDLLGRAGMLHEAFELIKSLAIKGDATSCRTLLSACRVQGDVKLGNCMKCIRIVKMKMDCHEYDLMMLLV